MTTQTDYILHNQLKQLLDSFTALLGIRIALFTPDGRELQAGLNKSPCAYCRRLRTEFGFETRCRSLDRKMLDRAATKRQRIYYRCHGRLSEAIIPLIGDKDLVGFLMIGQFRTRRQDCRDLLNTLPAGPRRKDLLAAYQATPCFDETQITNILAIYQAIADLTMVKGLIGFRQFQSIQPIIEFIRKNPARPLSLAEAADLAGKSTSSVSHLFKQLTGRSFKQYQIDAKLTHAQALLSTDPAKSVAEIATQLGYDDPFYFSRQFKKHHGQAPSNFKRTRQSH